MITVILTIGVFVIGAALGSFAMASVWRLRVLELRHAKRSGAKLTAADKRLLKVFGKRSGSLFSAHDRSVCLSCQHQLRWYTMVPVVSWLLQRGRCRQCQASIGKTELWAELGLGGTLAVSYAVWPYGFDTSSQVALFVIWAVAIVLLTIQFFYDLKWQLIPRLVTIGLLIVAGLYAAVYFIGVLGAPMELAGSYSLQVGLSLLVLPGFYLLLYVLSRGQWIGWGDVELLVPLAIMVAAWPASILLIFLANFIGCAVVLPGLLSKKLNRMTRIPFGPFLIAAFVVTMLWGTQLVSLYVDNFLFKP